MEMPYRPPIVNEQIGFLNDYLLFDGNFSD